MRLVLGILISCVVGLGAGPAMAQDAPDSTLTIDTTDLGQNLLHARQTIILDGDLCCSGGELALWYPKWVPGSHAPGGPIQNLAGFVITDTEGNTITWNRTPGEVYRIIAHVPEETGGLVIDFTYIANQASANSEGTDVWAGESLGIISPNAVLVYPEGIEDNQWTVQCSISLPNGWSSATAMVQNARVGNTITYEPVSLRRLVDSPIMIGKHKETYQLTEPDETPPQRMHVFSEDEDAVQLSNEMLELFREMVRQASLLFESHPFPSFDILLATTDELPANGLEHRRSSLDVLGLGVLDSPASLTGWNAMLIPHEYVHAWCGKYRRPAAMAHSDYHTPKGTDLLWVYEGLTMYLGEIIETRAGMISPEQYEWDIKMRMRGAALRQGRSWRPLIDTAAASHTLRAPSDTWGDLRRGQDYYYEGSLIWLAADAKIRELTEGERSLDDFCRSFFSVDDPESEFKPYTREDVIAELNRVAEYDWASFIENRVDTVGSDPLLVASALGYRVEYKSEPPIGPDGSPMDVLDARDSIGLRVRGNGTIRDVLLGSIADAAGLAPGMTIIGVGWPDWTPTFSSGAFEKALKMTTHTGTLRLILRSGNLILTKDIAYDKGPRYMTFVREDGAGDVIGAIVTPK